MRRRFRLFFLIVVILPSTAAAQPTIGFGGGTGLFVAPNPGDAYGVPVSTTGLVRLSTHGPTRLTGELSFSILPYIAVDELFGRSLMVLLDARVGATKELASYADGGLALRLLAGGGLYQRRIDGGRASGVTRRPLISIGPAVAISISNWEYEIGVRYRVLLDRAPVHSFEPAITILSHARAQEEPE